MKSFKEVKHMVSLRWPSILVNKVLIGNNLLSLSTEWNSRPQICNFCQKVQFLILHPSTMGESNRAKYQITSPTSLKSNWNVCFSSKRVYRVLWLNFLVGNICAFLKCTGFHIKLESYSARRWSYCKCTASQRQCLRLICYEEETWFVMRMLLLICYEEETWFVMRRLLLICYVEETFSKEYAIPPPTHL